MSTAISLRFPAGRYHATPWGRHANESDVEWPPSPWRILRALVATWHRKIDPAVHPEARLSGLIERLVETDPRYYLPPVTRSHSRHYMPVRAGAADRPVLVFDAFARIDPDAELIVAWGDVALDAAERELLASLVHVLGYLGRAESWVEGRLLDGYQGSFNCEPVTTDSSSAANGQPITLLATLRGATYTEWRDRATAELGLDAKRLTKAQRRTLATLPARLIDALRLDTADLRNAGWNMPPGGRMTTYDKPRDEVAARRARAVAKPHDTITTARLAIAGRPLPRIEDAVRIGEIVRMAAIRAADRFTAHDGVPSELSGHELAENATHQHAFYLPEDADDDGFIDHVLVHAPGGLTPHSVAALNRVPSLWTRDGAEWPLLLEGSWADAADSISIYCGASAVWRSATPYLHPWFVKTGFGIPEQIRRECGQRGLPDPIGIRALPALKIAGRERRPVHFHRFRSKRGLRQPDRRGSFVEITFGEPVNGPVALGFACHYGLGVFVPLQDFEHET